MAMLYHSGIAVMYYFIICIDSSINNVIGVIYLFEVLIVV